MKNKTIRFVKCSLFIFFLFFIILIILAPVYQRSYTIKDLSGSVGVIDNPNITKYMVFPWNYIYSFGDIWCHQKEERSFFINGNQMPIWARCTGLFLGIAIGAGVSIFLKIKIDENIHKKILVQLTIGYFPIMLDLTGQAIGLWHSINVVRILTGTLAGLTFAMIFGILIEIIGKAMQKSTIFYSKI